MSFTRPMQQSLAVQAELSAEVGKENNKKKMKNKKPRNNNTGHFMHCNKKRRNNNTGHFMHCNKELQCMKCPVLLFLGFLYFFFFLFFLPTSAINSARTAKRRNFVQTLSRRSCKRHLCYVFF